MKRILIMGAGAIGSVTGGLLRLAGHDVTLWGRPSHMDAVRKSGLTITGIWGDRHVTGLTPAARPGDLSPPFDIVLLTVKAYDTRAAAAEAAPFLGPDSLAVSFQNGLGNMEAIAEAAGPERTAGARVIFGAEIAEPGRVRVTVYAEPVVIGPFLTPPRPQAEERIAWIVRALNAAGIPSEAVDDVTPYLWAKVFYNAPLNPLSALLKATYGTLAGTPSTKTLMDRIIREAFDVARRMGVALPWTICDEYLHVFYHKLIPPTACHYASMLRDIEKGRKTEIDSINGMVCRYARETGTATPLNETLVALIKFKETGPAL